jgi:hypothetical protein
MARTARQSILYREIFFVEDGGSVRRLDWNMVNTSIGGAWEPRQFAEYFNIADTATGFPAIDIEDEMLRVDKLTILNGNSKIGFDFPYWTDQEEASDRILHGGHLVPGRDISKNDPVND